MTAPRSKIFSPNGKFVHRFLQKKYASIICPQGSITIFGEKMASFKINVNKHWQKLAVCRTKNANFIPGIKLFSKS
jgi:hypothetical protein